MDLPGVQAHLTPEDFQLRLEHLLIAPHQYSQEMILQEWQKTALLEQTHLAQE